VTRPAQVVGRPRTAPARSSSGHGLPRRPRHGSGDDSIGNFLDAVEFAISIPLDPEPSDPPAPDPASPAPDPSTALPDPTGDGTDPTTTLPDPTDAATAPPTDARPLGSTRNESDPGTAALVILIAVGAVTVAIRRLATTTRG
jgi:hypothetical protein